MTDQPTASRVLGGRRMQQKAVRTPTSYDAQTVSWQKHSKKDTYTLLGLEAATTSLHSITECLRSLKNVHIV